MIIYGSQTTLIGSEHVQDKCSNCGTTNSVELSLFQKYAHVFWIPLFPIGKTGHTECSHCKQVIEKNELQGIAKSTYDTLKAISKTPLWTFSGLVFFALLITTTIISEVKDNAENAKFIQNPESGDLYEIKLGENQYTLYKVRRVSGDTVFVIINQYQTNKITGLSDIKSKGHDAYHNEPVPLLKTDLKKMFSSGEIIDVVRN